MSERSEPDRAQPECPVLTCKGLDALGNCPMGYEMSCMAKSAARVDDFVEQVPGRCGGRLTFRGHRLEPWHVASRLRHGDTLDALCDDYPDVPHEAFEAVARELDDWPSPEWAPMTDRSDTGPLRRCFPWAHEWYASTIALVKLDANVPVTRCRRCGKVKPRAGHWRHALRKLGVHV